MMINYANLSNGIENCPPGSRFVRIQSSHFEAGAYWRAIVGLDYQFLFDAALVGVMLYDCGSRLKGGESRAQWQGCPWIMWAYAYANKLEFPDANPRLVENFERQCARPSTDKAAGKSKLRYVHEMTCANRLNIEWSWQNSKLDGNRAALRELLLKSYGEIK